MLKKELKKVMKRLTWREKIIIRIFPNTFVKIYEVSRKETMKTVLKYWRETT